jgi:hypothetical protein
MTYITASIEYDSVNTEWDVALEVFSDVDVSLGTFTYSVDASVADSGVALQYIGNVLSGSSFGGTFYRLDEPLALTGGVFRAAVVEYNYDSELKYTIGGRTLDSIVDGNDLADILNFNETVAPNFSLRAPWTHLVLYGQNLDADPDVFVYAVYNGTSWIYATRELVGSWTGSVSAVPLYPGQPTSLRRYVDPNVVGSDS